MGATAADTEREIGQLRGDMSAALSEVQRRLRGGFRGVAGAEARVSTTRMGDNVATQARQNPTLLGVAGVVAVAAVGYGVFAAANALRERQRPQNRLKRRVKEVRREVGERVDESRRQLDRVLPRGLLLKLDREKGGYMRVTEARVERPIDKQKERADVIKKLVWAGLLSVFMALGSVLARRVAGGVWRATVHEDPPTEKPKAKAVS